MIILVVDNKNRDLPSLVELASELNKKYHIDVVLANIFELDDLIILFKNKIDLILFSYLRDANKHKIPFARAHDIKIAIYDQEGANGLDGYGVIKDMKTQKKNLRFVNRYFFWGKKQFNKAKLDKSLKLPLGSKNIGYIRYDVNTSTLKKKEIFQKKFVLVNTNFALVDPRYSTPQKELKSIKKIKLYGNKSLRFVKTMRRHKSRFLSETEKLVKLNPTINFVLRPHPFEDISAFKNLSKKYKNCFFSTKYNSMNWIKFAKLIIHIDCMTSIEALSINKKSLSLSYIVEDQSLCYIVPYLSSIHSKNFENANKILRQIYFQNKKFKIKNNKLFKDFFGQKKDKPIKKIAKEIMKTAYSKDMREPIEKILKKEKLKSIKKLMDFPLRTKIKVFLRKKLSIKYFYYVYVLVVGRRIAKKYYDKCFNEDDIKNYLKKDLKFTKIYSNCFIFLKQ